MNGIEDDTERAVREAAAAMAAATGQTFAAAQAIVAAEMALMAAIAQPAGKPAAEAPPGDDDADAGFDNMPV